MALHVHGVGGGGGLPGSHSTRCALAERPLQPLLSSAPAALSVGGVARPARVRALEAHLARACGVEEADVVLHTQALEMLLALYTPLEQK